ncbi:hypothetical protein Hsw_0629 [Hymenobacter swuensis DY53]|uniref:Uncharacterized protein n=1 Tax=Hymenobacter swuensis DY53 TaxID=1227739 RepID=W8ESU2_9BACT|nr:hypothetical protein Hsw_0629 [Hymenobacter swuensis DY53]
MLTTKEPAPATVRALFVSFRRGCVDNAGGLIGFNWLSPAVVR